MIGWKPTDHTVVSAEFGIPIIRDFPVYTFKTLLRVLPVPEGDKEWYLYAARAGLPFGVPNHRRDFSLTTIARREAPTNRLAPLTLFSFIMARRRRWSAAMKMTGGD